MKKIFTMMISFLMLISQANAAEVSGLRQAFTELEYFIKVEWDQKDQKSYRDANQRFTHEIVRLQSEGLSNKDLISFVISEVQKVNPIKAEEISKLFNIISITSMSTAEVQSHVLDILQENSVRGASWNGELISALGIVLMAGVFAAALVIMYGSQQKNPKDCRFTCKNGSGSGYCFELDANPGFCN